MLENPATFIALSFFIFLFYLIKRGTQPILTYLDDKKKQIEQHIADAHAKLDHARQEFDLAKQRIEDMETQIHMLEEQTHVQIQNIEKTFKEQTATLLRLKQERGLEYLAKLQYQLENDMHDYMANYVLSSVRKSVSTHEANPKWDLAKENALNMI